MKTLCVATVVAVFLLAGCAGRQTQPKTQEASTEAVSSPATDPELGPSDELLIAAGDIADCNENDGAGAKATAAVIARFPKATVIAPGDIAYLNGTVSEFKDCYNKVWGAHKERTRPAPGNHDYGIYIGRDNADPYFAYFGANAGTAKKGYYSFDLGSWHIVSLNGMAGQVKSAPSMEEQRDWLEKDLKENQNPCILAFWHQPRFSSGKHGNDPKMAPLWDALYAKGADVIVNGHDHNYERFALQSPAGAADPMGIRELVAGTGGIQLRKKGKPAANSETFLSNNATDHGVLLLTLHPNSYEWKFRRTNGTDGDASTEPVECHPKG